MNANDARETRDRWLAIQDVLRDDYEACKRLGISDENWMQRVTLAAVLVCPTTAPNKMGRDY
jgi:hypothetical protein